MDAHPVVVGMATFLILTLATVIGFVEFQPFTNRAMKKVKAEQQSQILHWLETRANQAKMRGDNIEREVTEILLDDARSAFEEGKEPWDVSWLMRRK